MKQVITVAVFVVICFFSCTNQGKKSKAPQQERIRNREAYLLYVESNTASEAQAIDLLTRADNVEPQSPLILQERARIRFNSKLDVKGSFNDLDSAIAYSLDPKDPDKIL